MQASKTSKKCHIAACVVTIRAMQAGGWCAGKEKITRNAVEYVALLDEQALLLHTVSLAPPSLHKLLQMYNLHEQ